MRASSTFTRQLLLALCLLFSSLFSGAQALAQPAPYPWQSTLEDARQHVEVLRSTLQQPQDDPQLQALRLQALQAYRQTNEAAQEIQPVLATVQERQRELGQAADGESGSQALVEERQQLEREAGELESQAKLAALVALDASHALERIATQRRDHFNARLGARSASILSGAFWADLASTTRLDTARSRGLLADARDTLAQLSVWQWLLAVAWVLGMAAAGAMLQRRVLQDNLAQVPSGRLRRALFCWTRVLLAVAVPVLLLEGLRLALGWIEPVSAATHAFITGAVGTVGFCGYIIGLGQGMLMPSQPAWRLLALQDDTAAALRHVPLGAALFIGVSWLAENLAVLASVRLAMVILIHSIAGLLLILMLAGVVHRLQRRPAAQPGQEAPWLARLLARRRGLVILLAWLALGFSLISLLIGYVALATFILKQIIWCSVILATATLLSLTATDLSTLRARQGRSAEARPAAWRVLLGGIAQMMIALFALLLLFAPYGQGPLDIYEQIERLRGSLSIGDLQLRPTAILQGLLWLVLGLAAVKAAKHWLAQHLLPATKMDLGMQASASTLAGYLGYVIVVATALSAAGVGLERVTWIASALSVGIGFGLQAIVQNFVSGLILLTERPVKVGDWVSLSGMEGDIRRINVRATEIQMSDRSRIVVPNSEFITKIVRNVTPINALGRVQIKLPLPVETDAAKARELLLAAFASDAAILPTPAPEVYLDDISGSALLFNAVAYVSSPRQAYSTRSRVLFDMLHRLRQAGIAVSSPTTMLLAPQGAPKSAPADAPHPPSTD